MRLEAARVGALKLLCGQFEVGEPKVLGEGIWGPVIRARHVSTYELVAVKVFNAQEAYQNGRIRGCHSALDARTRALRAFTLEVRALQQLTGFQSKAVSEAAEDDSADDWLQQLGACPDAVVHMLGFSHDDFGRPAEAEDSCCYIVLELGQCTLEDLVATRPPQTEIRQTMRSLFSMLASLHRSGCVLRSHSPRYFMLFSGGWKLLSASELRPPGWTMAVSATWTNERGWTAPWHVAPEYAQLIVLGSDELVLRQSADVWSVALMCLEMVWGKPLLHEMYEQMR